jgi:hypothetical protein
MVFEPATGISKTNSAFSANILCESGNLLVTDFTPPVGCTIGDEEP